MSLRPLRDRRRERARPRARRRARRRRAGRERQRARLADAAAAAAGGAARGRPRAGRAAGAAGRPDDRSARDLAADLRAFLAPRRVRFYPSRGTGYASTSTPPPHLVGLRIDALDALSREADAIVVACAAALAEAVPDASLRPAGFEIAKGDEIDLGAVAERPRRGGLRTGRAGRGTRPVRRPRRHPRRLPGDRGTRGAGRALRRRGRVDALVLDLHPAQPRRGRGGRAGAGRRARRRAP